MKKNPHKRFLAEKRALGRAIVQDEMFAVALYNFLATRADKKTRPILLKLLALEKRHVAYWQDFFEYHPTSLYIGKRVKKNFFKLMIILFGNSAVHLVLEAVEIYGVRKYLLVWDRYSDNDNRTKLKDMVREELSYEDELVSTIVERRISPERVRNIFFGFNDGLVEILGASSGFFAAFQSVSSTLAAGVLVGVAGALSMSAGAYVALSSEREIERLGARKRAFLEEHSIPSPDKSGSLSSAFVVGISYIIGAMIPLTPIMLGAKSVIPTFITGGIMLVLLSMVLAFLSGMKMRRRIFLNVAILAITLSITYALGMLIKHIGLTL